MLCNLCHKNQATVHLTEIVDEQMSELHLCDDCARKKSMQMEQQFGLSDLLAGLVDYGKQFSGIGQEAAVDQCSSCGLSYEDFRKIGRLGCSQCYVSFAKYLGPLLKRIHGASQHIGKVPAGGATAGSVLPEEAQVKPPAKESALKTVSVSELKQRLQEAISKEEFEEAAKLRDAIKDMETARAPDKDKTKGSIKKHED